MAGEPGRLSAPFDAAARRAQMFPALDPEQVARIAPFGREKTFEDGEVVFEQGDRCVPFYVVLEGELVVVHPQGLAEDLVTVHRQREFSPGP